jgi:uncharacterized protein (TIGR02266 family)
MQTVKESWYKPVRWVPGFSRLGIEGAWFGRVYHSASARLGVEELMSVKDPREREFPRYEVSAYVDYTGSEVLLYHRIQNISLGGVCIASPSIEEVGSVVDLVINFPELGTSISMRGEVAWANREPPMDMGIRYIEMDDQKRDTLKQYIARVKK